MAFGKKCVGVASEAESAWIGLQSIVEGQGKSFSVAKGFLENYTQDGLIPLTNAVTAYKNLATRGYDDTQIQKTLTALKDSAAFGRQASYSYGEAIQSATEGLKNENSILVDNAGVTKNVAKMWEDYAKSIGKTSQSLTQQEKINAEVNGILEESRFQVGDASKYADTFAGRIARLSQTFYTLKMTIGQVIMPIANLFIPIIQVAMQKLISFFTVIKQVLSAFGIKASKPVSNVSNSLNEIGDNALSSADKATKASKKMQKAIMNYDELNILSRNKDTSHSDTSNSNSSTSNISTGDLFVESEDKISPQISKIVNNAKKMWKGLKKTVDSVWNSDVVQSYVNLVGTRLQFVCDFGIRLFDSFKNNIKTTWSNIEKNVYDSLNNMSYLWTDFNNTLSTTISTYGPLVIQSFIDLFNNIWTTAFDPFIQLAIQIWTDFTSDLVELWNLYGQPLADNIGSFVSGLIDTFNGFWTHIMVPIIQPFLSMLSELWEKHIRGLIKEALNFVGNVVNSFLTLYNKWGKPIIDFLAEVLEPVFSATFNNIWNIVGSVVGFVSDIIQNLIKTFNGICTFLTGVFTGDWTRALEGLKNIFGGIFSSLSNLVKTPLNMALGMIEGFINKVIGGFNMMKKVINKISFEAPDWVPGIGGKKIGFNLPMSDNISLPRLYNGGWVEPNKPRPVIVGDNKKEGEIIAPESKIYAQAYKASLDAQKNSEQGKEYRLQITLIHKYPDGRYMIQEINDTQIRDGKITLLT